LKWHNHINKVTDQGMEIQKRIWDKWGDVLIRWHVWSEHSTLVV